MLLLDLSAVDSSGYPSLFVHIIACILIVIYLCVYHLFVAAATLELCIVLVFMVSDIFLFIYMFLR